MRSTKKILKTPNADEISHITSNSLDITEDYKLKTGQWEYKFLSIIIAVTWLKFRIVC